MVELGIVKFKEDVGMFGKERRIRGLEKKVSSALGVVTKTIEELEATNNEYDKLRVELEDEMTQTREHHRGVVNAICQNKKVVENFKNLLR